ncbi:hypothetical protein FRB97_006284 [Tulasnella sp. 331]|nr:hypothetical protein FRB97_006284 [Tulasnella sp. 331]
MPYPYTDSSSASTSISSESPPQPVTPYEATELFPHQQSGQHHHHSTSSSYKSQEPRSPYTLNQEATGALEAYDAQHQKFAAPEGGSSYAMSSTASRQSAQSLSHILTSFKTLDATGDGKSPTFPLQPASVTNHPAEAYSSISSASSSGDASSSCSPADLFQGQQLQYQAQTPASELSSAAGDPPFFGASSGVGSYGSEYHEKRNDDGVYGGGRSAATTSAIRLAGPSDAHDESRREHWPLTSADMARYSSGATTGDPQQHKYGVDTTPRHRSAYFDDQQQHFDNGASMRQATQHHLMSSDGQTTTSLPPMRTSTGPILPRIGDLTDWPPRPSSSSGVGATTMSSSASTQPQYNGLNTPLINHRHYQSNSTGCSPSYTPSYSAPSSMQRSHSSQYGRSFDENGVYSQQQQQQRVPRSDGWNPEYIPGGADYGFISSGGGRSTYPQQQQQPTSSAPYYGSSAGAASLQSFPKSHGFQSMRFDGGDQNRPVTSAGFNSVGYDGAQAMAVTYTDNSGEKETPHLRRKCFNCSCTEPPSWRRSTMTPGKIVCNRCGLYERTHNRARPSTAVGDLRKLGSKGVALAYATGGAASSSDPYTSMPTNAKTGESLRTSKKISPHEQHQHAPYHYQ